MKKLFYIVFILSYINIYPQWHIQNPYPTGNNFNAVKLISENIGWAVGSAGTILKTIDGGVTWESVTSGTKSELTDINFIDQNTGWIVGADGVILKTTNGGSDWAPRKVDGHLI